MKIIYNFISLIKFEFKLWNEIYNLFKYNQIPMNLDIWIW
jgi:hypothetical protein